MGSEIVETKTVEIAAAQRTSATPGDLVRYALDNGADIERLEKLMAMQIQWEEREAKKAFTAAMAEFKSNPPDIFKEKLVGFENRDGSFTGYKHATLGGVCEKVIAALASVGISHKWDIHQAGGLITVTCVLTHRLGYSDGTKMEAGADNSGKKNNIQASASTISYLQRYTLLAATGLATKDQDDDGGGADTQQVVGSAFSLSDILRRIDSATDELEIKEVRREGLSSASSARDKYAYDLIARRVSERRQELGIVIDAEGPSK